jgi:hypothetical protein
MWIAGEIGQGAGDAEHAGIAACREAQAFAGLGEDLAAGLVRGGMGFEQAAIGLGVGACRGAGIAAALDLAGGGDAGGNGAAGFGGGG